MLLEYIILYSKIMLIAASTLLNEKKKSLPRQYLHAIIDLDKKARQNPKFKSKRKHTCIYMCETENVNEHSPYTHIYTHDTLQEYHSYQVTCICYDV